MFATWHVPVWFMAIVIVVPLGVAIWKKKIT